MTDFAKIVRTTSGEQILRYIEQSEDPDCFRLLCLTRYPTIDDNVCAIFEGSLAECERELAGFDTQKADDALRKWQIIHLSQLEEDAALLHGRAS